jgi:cytochrome P450
MWWTSDEGPVSFPGSREGWQDARVNLAAHPLAWTAARLVRGRGPLVRVPGVGVLVNDPLLAHEILTRDGDFTKNGPGSIAGEMTRAFGPAALANMDGDPHRSLRQRLGPVATGPAPATWLALARSPVEGAAADLAAGRHVEFSRVARILSGRLTLALVGSLPREGGGEAPDEEALAVHALGERIASSLRIRPMREGKAARVRDELDALLSRADPALARSAPPRDSLAARLQALECSPEEVRGILSIFFVAGALTLGVALPRIVALLVDSGAFRELVEDPALIPGAVDEGLRYAAPVPATVRIVARPVEIAGTRLAPGTRLVILTLNLARSPVLFPDPDRFDIHRPPEPRARYLWYGAGPHFCMGFGLAQEALRDTVARLVAVPGTLRITRRRAARGVLLPAWEQLELVALPGADGERGAGLRRGARR